MSGISSLDRQRMDELTAGVRTKSDKIRRLAAAGYARADIARYLGIRYQFVYNVLSGPQPKSARLPRGSAPEATAEPASPEPTEPALQWVWTTVRKGGAIELPAFFLASMGVTEGDPVQLALEGGVIRVLSRAAALCEAQELVRRYVPEGVSLVDELLAERRAEAAREEGR